MTTVVDDFLLWAKDSKHALSDANVLDSNFSL